MPSEKFVSYIMGRTMYRVRVFNVTFNNTSVISWRSVLLVKETGVLGENKIYDANDVHFILDHQA
jgi:hypothetical protein